MVIAGLDPAIHDAALQCQITGSTSSQTNRERRFYVGVTNNLVRRVYEHREGFAKGFTQRYGLKMLAYFEKYETPDAAIQREKNIKHWSRTWKLQLVESANPQWRDLYNDITR